MAEIVGASVRAWRPAERVPEPQTAGGLSVGLSVDEALAPHAACLARICAAYGHAAQEAEQHLLAPIRALATWVHDLPGLPDSGFDHRGGALEQGLTYCLHSLQCADGHTFQDPITQTTCTEATECWRLGCALAGLFAVLPPLLSRIEVRSNDGACWPATAVPLLHWLMAKPDPRYRYRWRDGGAQDPWPALFVACRCIGSADVALFASGDDRVLSGMMRSIVGDQRSPANPVSAVVRQVMAAVAAHRGFTDPPSPGHAPPVAAALSRAVELVAAHGGIGAGATDESFSVSSGTTTPVQTTTEAATTASIGAAIGATGVAASPRADPPCTPPADTGACDPQQFPSLTADTSRITNPLARELIDRVIGRLEQAADTMLAEASSDGIVVALSEFAGSQGDAAAIVRALHQAGLLESDGIGSSGPVHLHTIGEAQHPCVVLSADRLAGYAQWCRYWQTRSHAGPGPTE